MASVESQGELHLERSPTRWWVVATATLVLALGYGRKSGDAPAVRRARSRRQPTRPHSRKAGEHDQRASEPGRGRSATTPSEIPARGWKDILVRVYREIGDDRVVAFAAVTWLVASLLFSWYAANFGSYNKTYGSLGAAIGFMTWIWLSTIVILVGAEIDAEWSIRQQRTRPKAHRNRSADAAQPMPTRLAKLPINASKRGVPEHA
jgi:hypothetical protein